MTSFESDTILLCVRSYKYHSEWKSTQFLFQVDLLHWAYHLISDQQPIPAFAIPWLSMESLLGKYLQPPHPLSCDTHPAYLHLRLKPSPTFSTQLHQLMSFLTHDPCSVLSQFSHFSTRYHCLHNYATASIILFLKVCLFVWQSCRETEGRKRRWDPFTGSLPKWPQPLGLSQAEPRSQIPSGSSTRIAGIQALWSHLPMSTLAGSWSEMEKFSG